MIITYKVSDFNHQKARAGSLCIMVREDATYQTVIDGDKEYNTISDKIYEGDTLVGNPDFMDAGICTYSSSSSKFVFTVAGETYYFDNRGYFYDSSSICWQLKLATIIIQTDSSSSNTRSIAKSTGETVDDSPTIRDQFAMESLKSIMAKIDKNLVEFGDNEMNYYCQQAYRWADRMMVMRKMSKQTVVKEIKQEER